MPNPCPPCPSCRVPLVMSERQGVEIDYCPQYRGVWLDRGELDKIIERGAQDYAAAAAPQPGPAAHQPPPCPATTMAQLRPHHGSHHFKRASPSSRNCSTRPRPRSIGAFRGALRRQLNMNAASAWSMRRRASSWIDERQSVAGAPAPVLLLEPELLVVEAEEDVGQDRAQPGKAPRIPPPSRARHRARPAGGRPPSGCGRTEGRSCVRPRGRAKRPAG